MKLEFVATCSRTYAVWANDEHVGNLIQGVKKPWTFVGRLDYLGISPRTAAGIRTGTADFILMLNIKQRLTS